MKKLFVFLAFLFVGLSAFAQFPGGGMPGKSMPSLGHVTGKLTDSAGKPIAGASVLIMQTKFDSTTKKSKDILVKGLTTGSNGEFDAEELPLMGIKIKISATGFKETEQAVQFLDPSKMPKPGAAPASGGMPPMPTSFDKDLGKIELKGDAANLQGVTVTTSTSALKMDIDKKVFNVEKNIVSAGGTAVDVIRNVPSIQVDIDGNVKLRNASPQIYVDGRPTTLSLDQIPADAISSVEVITNPSAKYDASGGNAGILNIVLKKNKKSGYNGNIMAGVDSRGGINGGGNFSLRQGKINFTAAAMTNLMRNRTTGTTDRLNLGDTQSHVFQNNLNKTHGGFLFGKVGFDYFVTNKTTLSLSGIKVHGEFKPNEVIGINTDSLFTNGNITSSYSQRVSNSSRTFNANGLQGGFVHNFAKDGEQWTGDFNYFSGKSSSDAMYTTSYYAGSTISGTSLQRVVSSGGPRFLTVQTDYAKPIGASSKFETGLRAQLRKLTNINDTYAGATEEQFTKVSTGSTNYQNHDNVYAAYVNFKSSIKDFGYQFGLRAENSDYKGELLNTGEVFKNNYPVSLFPSAFISQKLKNKQELQASYTRRINRPNFFQIIPYTDYTDSLNITRGNPALKPEFTNSFEVSYGKTFKGNNNILASLYYKHTTDLITRYLQEGLNGATGKEDIINTYINAASSYSYGAEFTSVNYVSKWWNVTSNINVYNSKINTGNIANATQQDALWSWFGKVNNNFTLPHNFSIQLSGDYQSKTNLPVNTSSGQPGPPSMQAQSSSQGYIRSFWGVDAAVKKTFLKDNKATVSLSISDIFRTRKQDQYSYNNYFVQNYYRLNNPQLVRLNLSYRFGKMDVGLFKRTKQSSGLSDATSGM